MNESTRRKDLSGIRLPIVIKRDEEPHAGLWLDKFIFNQESKGGQEKKDTPKTALVKEVARIPVPESYGKFFERWKTALKHLKARTGTATAQGRMAIGLGDESVLETSVKLHHTYGVPYIPGSALKGLAASYARNRIGGVWAKGKHNHAYNIVFGRTEEAGYISFHDALYIPALAAGQPLRSDVITVHHPDYYANKNKPPADWDDPNPVPFLSATGEYLVALSAIPGCEMWLAQAWKILERALREEGIGAKTSSGYGRMELKALEDKTK